MDSSPKLPGTLQGHSPGTIVEALREQIAKLERTRQPAGRPPLSSGCPDLDRLLPEGGFRWGTLVEWLSAGEGGGASTLATLAAREACRSGGVLVVLDASREFYAPAAARLGLELDRLIVLQAAGEADNLWALDQSLRSPAVAAVVAWPDRLDSHTFRRLQLAAEEGGGMGLLIRPAAARHEPSWAEVRLWVEPRPYASSAGRRLLIEVLRSRGSAGGGSVEVEMDDETHTLHLAPRLAPATTLRRVSGAS
jgi:protein ImuA